MQIPSLIWMLQLMNVSKGQNSTSVLRFKRKCHIHIPFANQIGVVVNSQSRRGVHMETISMDCSAFREQCGHRFPVDLLACTQRIYS